MRIVINTSCTESRAVTTYRQMRQMSHAQFDTHKKKKNVLNKYEKCKMMSANLKHILLILKHKNLRCKQRKEFNAV